MAEYDKSISGYFTATGNAYTINLPFIPSWIELRCQGNASGDQWINSSSTQTTKEAYWYQGMAANTALVTTNTASAATDSKLFYSSNGFNLFQSVSGALGSLNVGTGITAANPAVVSLTSQPYSVGQTVRIVNSTGMLQVSGLSFTVTATTTNSFTLGYLNASGFSAAATANTSQLITYPNGFLPKHRFITSISQASSAVIIFATTHGYSVGDQIRLYIPSQFGMTQANGALVYVTAVNTGTNSITVGLNTSSFTAFAFPTSAIASVGTSFAMAVPVGEMAGQFDASFQDFNTYGVTFGSNICGTNGALMLWKAGLSLNVYTS